MSRVDVHPTNAVEPNIKACMACNESGDISNTRCVIAPNTTPTTTPANNSRSVWPTPLDSDNVNNTANKAPQKAAPVKPTRIHRLLEKTLTTKLALLPSDSALPNMPAPLPITANAMATPIDAPDALPSK